MSGPAALAVWTGVLADAGLKATVLLGVAGLASRALSHRPAAERHAVWALSLAALPALPLLGRGHGATLAWDAPGLFAVWSAGVLLTLLPVGVGWWRLSRLPLEDARREDGVRLALSPQVRGPLTFGAWPATVVLPADATAWSDTDREAALRHELAHVRRLDWLVQMCTWTVVALFWFHPVVWWAHHRLTVEAEHAADEAVLSTGLPASDYAAFLLGQSAQRRRLAALGAGSLIGRRVRALLAARRPGTPSLGAPIGLACVLGASAVALAAFPAWHAPPETLSCQPLEILP